jgi:hypothetical protein
MRKLSIGAMAAFLFTASTASADVQLVLSGGRVSIVAKDATLRQILAEWARVGQTTVVNIERIPGGPLTLELTDVSEGEALDVLLRSVSGYMAAPRETPVDDLSIFDRIFVMPVSAAPRPAPAPASQILQQSRVASDPGESADDESSRATALGRARGLVNALTSVPVAPNADAGVPTITGSSPRTGEAQPTAPTGGTSAPGMMTPPVQPPPVNPAQWRPGMPTYQQPIPAGVPTAQPGQVGRPTTPPAQTQSSKGRGGSTGQ